MARRLPLLPVAVALMLLFSSAAYAKSVYVSDRLVVGLRRTPKDYRTVTARVVTGDRVSIVQTGKSGWVKIRTAAGVLGWIKTQYLQENPPAAILLKNMDPKSKDLGNRVKELGAANLALKNKLAEATGQAAALKSQLQKLKTDASNVLKLRSEYEELKGSCTRQRERLSEVTAQNESLRFASNLKWFLAGAAVLILGTILGLLIGRRSKRFSSSIR